MSRKNGKGHGPSRLDLVDAPRNGHAVLTSAPPPATSRDDRYEPAFPIKGIVESKTNPRKTFDEIKLGELAESIKTYGVLEPILVRPTSMADNLQALTVLGVVEVIAGARRLRAAQLAGVKTVPVRILNLTDDQALEVQVVENLQRDDLDPLEEAEGFRQLLKLGRYNASTLAGKLGKSEAYIYGSLKLLDLPKPALEALKDGVISRSIAQLIGRIPSQTLREEAADEILQEIDFGQINNYKEAKEHVERNYMVELKGAPFDQAEDTLTPAGPCTTCPARAGNARHLYPDARADICTDTACFREKVRAHAERREQEARDAGQAVIDHPEKLFNSYKARENAGHDLRHDAPWVDLNARCYEDPKQRTFREILGESAADAAAVAVDQAGVAHDLVPRKLADKVLVDKKIIGPGSRRPTHVTADDAKRVAEQKIRAEVGRRLQAEGAAAAERLSNSWLGAGPAFILPMAAGVVHQFWSDAQKRVAARRGATSIEHEVKNLSPRDCLALIVELVLARYAIEISGLYHGGGDRPHVKELLAALKIDRAAIEKAVRAEAKQKAEKKKAKK